MRRKNRITYIFFVLLGTTFLIILLYQLKIKIGFILIAAAIPTSFYAIYFGIKDYQKFFSEEEGIEFEGEKIKKKLNNINIPELLNITLPDIGFDKYVFDDIKLVDIVYDKSLIEDLGHLYDLIDSTVQLIIPAERNLTKDEYHLSVEKHTEIKPICISLDNAEFAQAF